MTPKFSLGEHVWYAGVGWLPKRITCPDCFGKKFLTVILGDDSQVTVECTECKHGYEGPTGTIQSHDYQINTEYSTIRRVEQDVHDGKDRLQYGMSNGRVLDSEDVFTTREEAQARSEVLLVEQQEAERQRLLKKHKDTRSWAWNATYHRGCIRKAEKDLTYHRAKLAVALEHKKEEKNVAAI